MKYALGFAVFTIIFLLAFLVWDCLKTKGSGHLWFLFFGFLSLIMMIMTWHTNSVIQSTYTIPADDGSTQSDNYLILKTDRGRLRTIKVDSLDPYQVGQVYDYYFFELY